MKLFIVAKKQKDEKRDQNPVIRFKEKLCWKVQPSSSGITNSGYICPRALVSFHRP